MGFFSWTCAKTNLPILHGLDIVVLDRDGGKILGVYDGYGRVESKNLQTVELDYDAIEEGRVKLLLKEFYKDEEFNQVGRSQNEPGQGHFHDMAKLKRKWRANAFPTYESYCEWYRKADPLS